ncbi:hypothetical protein HUW51_11585 [Adhaeribacter swui]|uniref:Lipoprotein n=1 Tax=Adhaeribacter swui TaxID=2086471 RepID=A0A7G7G851_9BACT|nr:hypothetical protein [Adhaeribacter swui]QNF33335.1 hypothetical protein HUW51_11585 [Adhaeribacter swui]
MKKCLLTLLYIQLLAVACISQKKIKKYDFSLTIGSCFESDTVDVRINGQEVVSNAIVQSDFSTGITQLTIYQDDKGLWILYKNKRTNLNKIAPIQIVDLDIRINGMLTSKKIDLRKGWNLMLENCYVTSKTGQPARTVTVNQYKKTLVLE